MKQIIINSEELQVRVAVVEDGKLQDFFMERTNKDRIVGSIYKGRIKNLEPSLQAAFVDIGVGKNAFLHYWDMLPASQDVLEEGDDDDDEGKGDLPMDDDDEFSAEIQRSDAAPNDDDGSVSDSNENGHSEENASEAAPFLPGATLHSRLHTGNDHFDTHPHADGGSVTKNLLPLTKEQKGTIIPLSKVQQSVASPISAEAAVSQEATADDSSEKIAVTVQDNPTPEAFKNGEKQNKGGNENGNQRKGNNHRRRHHGHGGNNNSGNEGAATEKKQKAPSEKKVVAAAGKPGFFRRLCTALLPSWLGGNNASKNAPVKTPVQTRGGKPQVVPLPGANVKGGSQGGKGQIVPLQPKATKGAEASGGAAQNSAASKPVKAAKTEKKGPTVDDIPNLFHVDQEILVQVTKGPIGTKGARVTTNLSIPGRNLVLLPNCSHVGISRRVEDREERSRLKQMIKTLTLPSNMGLICRTVGAGLKREHFQRDLDILLDAWHSGEELAANHRAPVCIYQEPALEERVLRDCMTQDVDEIIVDTQEAYDRATQMISRFDKDSAVKVKLYSNPTPVFIKYGVSQQIESICNRKVMLPSGGYLCIDETEALIAIDVNTGKNRSGKDQPETILETNMEAVKEIARQLRLRNIGGLVVLDLIDMRSRKDQMAVYRAFKQYVSEDHARIKVYPISGLGLLEMSRQRESESWQSTIFEDCPYCKGRGLIKTATSISVEIQRRLNELMARRKEIKHFVITVHPKILDRLRTADHTVMDAMAAEHERQLTFSGNPNLHIEEYHITDKETGKEF